MPFELGLAVAYSRQNSPHTFYVFEEMKYRLSKSLSDLDGTDIIHGATLTGYLVNWQTRSCAQTGNLGITNVDHLFAFGPGGLRLRGNTIFRAPL